MGGQQQEKDYIERRLPKLLAKLIESCLLQSKSTMYTEAGEHGSQLQGAWMTHGDMLANHTPPINLYYMSARCAHTLDITKIKVS